MDVALSTRSPLESGADTVVVGVFEGESVATELAGERITALLDRGEARPNLGHVAVLHAEDQRAIVTGLGARGQFDPERARAAAAAALARALELRSQVICWAVPEGVSEDALAGLVEGTLLRAYSFDRYKPERARRPGRLILSGTDQQAAARVNRAAVVAAAQNRARDLGNAPPNEMNPAALADYARALGSRHPEVSVTVMGEQAIREAGMGAFAAVARGSVNEAMLIRLDYDGGAASGAPLLGFIGKGLTFDSGGISLKPPASMIEMKFDMCGGAAVIEAIAAIAELRAPVRVLGIVGAAENLPSGSAVKPGDIVRALDSTTIEVNNTDAEGRLVLADCLSYARREGAERLVDLATLTMIDAALGSTYAGLMSNDEPWAARLLEASVLSGDPLWRMPLHEDYAAMIKGRYAQITNRTERREAMPLTAAEFLHHFVGDTPWAHIDMAGTANDVPRPYYQGKGATGFGVRLLVELALRSESA